MIPNNTYYSKIITTLEKSKNQEALIENLRSLGYEFQESKIFLSQNPLFLTKLYYESYSFMIRRIKGKLWDLRLVVGIKLWGKKTHKILLFWEKEFLKKLDIPWKEEQDINFKKIQITVKFPDYLDYEQRKKWRQEHAKIIKNPNIKPSEFYLKSKADIIFIDKK